MGQSMGAAWEPESQAAWCSQHWALIPAQAAKEEAAARVCMLQHVPGDIMGTHVTPETGQSQLVFIKLNSTHPTSWVSLKPWQDSAHSR